MSAALAAAGALALLGLGLALCRAARPSDAERELEDALYAALERRRRAERITETE